MTPDDIRRVLTQLAKGIILIPIFDEFDRIEDAKTCLLMADAIKSLSDYSVDATILIIGVADSVDELIKGHQSIERALIQIPMPRMSNDEISEIIDKGLNELKMNIEDGEKRAVVTLSQGLPYVAHLLSLHSTQSAIGRKVKLIQQDDLQNGISVALSDWQQSIKAAYYNATQSQQPGNKYREVVLACALATTNEFKYFSAADVRDSLRAIISDQSRGVPNPTRYLKQLSGLDRGELLHRTGRGIGLQYRFSSPLMRPYIVMRGIQEGAVARESVSRIVGQ